MAKRNLLTQGKTAYPHLAELAAKSPETQVAPWEDLPKDQPEKPKPPSNVAVTDGSEVEKPKMSPEPTQAPLAPLSARNSQELDKACAKLRSHIRFAQQERSTGWVWIGVHVKDGTGTGRTQTSHKMDEE